MFLYIEDGPFFRHGFHKVRSVPFQEILDPTTIQFCGAPDED